MHDPPTRTGFGWPSGDDQELSAPEQSQAGSRSVTPLQLDLEHPHSGLYRPKDVPGEWTVHSIIRTVGRGAVEGNLPVMKPDRPTFSAEVASGHRGWGCTSCQRGGADTARGPLGVPAPRRASSGGVHEARARHAMARARPYRCHANRRLCWLVLDGQSRESRLMRLRPLATQPHVLSIERRRCGCVGCWLPVRSGNQQQERHRGQRVRRADTRLQSSRPASALGYWT